MLTQHSLEAVVRSQREEAFRFGNVAFPYSFTVDASPQSNAQQATLAEHSGDFSHNGIQVTVRDMEE